MTVESDMGDRSRQYFYPYTQKNPQIKQSFSLVSRGEFYSDASYYTKRSGMPAFLVIYTLDGAGIMEYDGGVSRLEGGSLLVINCNRPQYYKTAESHWHFLWFHFSAEVGESLVDFINQGGLFTPQMQKDTILNQLQTLEQLAKSSKQEAEFSISLWIHNFLQGILQLKATKLENLWQEKNVEQALSYIHDHRKNTLSLDKLAQIAGLSKFYFIKQFKAVTGKTPHQYVLLTRLNEAKALLLNTQMPIGEVAIETGFCDAKNFITNFKKTTGETPNQFRKNNIP